ncbi:hypothetical protein CISIN_1g045620mg, partial [Citrus sinensis]
VNAAVGDPSRSLSLLPTSVILSILQVLILGFEDPKTDHLRELDGAKERLLLLKANLLEEGSFDSAVDGCEEVPTATGRFAVVGRVAHDYEVLKILHED